MGAENSVASRDLHVVVYQTPESGLVVAAERLLSRSRILHGTGLIVCSRGGPVWELVAGAPVRVIRGAHRGSAYAPQTGYRYDGPFLVQDAWRERGHSGFLVCRYRLMALDAAVGDVLAQGSANEPDDGPEVAPTGNAPVVVKSTETVDLTGLAVGRVG